MVDMTPHHLLPDKEADQRGHKNYSHSPNIAHKQSAERGIGKTDQKQYPPPRHIFFGHDLVVKFFDPRQRQLFIVCTPAQCTQIGIYTEIKRQHLSSFHRAVHPKTLFTANTHNNRLLKNGNVRHISKTGSNTRRIPHYSGGMYTLLPST